MKRLSRFLLLAAVVACISASYGCSNQTSPGQSGFVAYQVPIQTTPDVFHESNFPCPSAQ